MKQLNIGLFGFGCVGSGLYEVLNQSKLLSASISKIVVKNKDKSRPIAASNFFYDKAVILDNPTINVVVELIDDADAAYDIVTEALKKGKHVVSANKKLIAHHLEELIRLAKTNNVSFLYEASTCASIPIIRNLEEYYNNDFLDGVEGVCNGTSNYILTKLFEGNQSFNEVLKEAQNLGFAESDPTMDIDGFDSKFKLQILLKHAFGLSTQPNQVLNLGIRHIKERDIQFAKEKALKIRLLSTAKKVGNKIVVCVAPTFISADHFGFDINNEFNGVSIQALFSDAQVFTGKGAGSYPTASAVLSDVSALQYNYKYEYKRNREAEIKLATDAWVKTYVSSANLNQLEQLEFAEIAESFRSEKFAYKVGYLNLKQLTHEFYRNNPDIFIAFYENTLQLDSPLVGAAAEITAV